jgi:hypothetical protein
LRTILVDEQVGVNAELAVMLRLEVTVKGEQLFPLHHGKSGVQRVEVCDLDISVVVIVAGRILEGHPSTEMVALLVTTYVAILSGPAQRIDPHKTAKTHPLVVPDADGDEPFNYIDTASSRAGIVAATSKLKLDKIASRSLRTYEALRTPHFRE